MALHIDKQDIGGIRKLFQDLVAPEISSIKTTLSLMREEAKAAEARSEQNFALIREEMKAAELRSEQNFKAAEGRSEQNFALIREEIKAAELRSEQNFSLLREDVRQIRGELVDRIERSRREVLLAVENQSLKQELEQLRAARREQPSA